RPQGVDLAAGDDGRGARPGGVADEVAAGVLVLPDDLAVGGVEAEDALGAVDAARLGRVRLGRVPGGEEVHDEDAVADDGGAGVAAAEADAPEDLRPAPGELVEDAGLAPDAIAPRPEPPRPVVGAG